MGSPLSDRVSDRAELDFPLARRNTCLGAIFASNFAFGLAFGGLSPLISLTLESQGITEFLIGINSAIGAVGVACFAPLAPKLFIRYGAGIPLFACSILFIGAIALFPWFDDYFAWLALRFAIGAGIAMPWILTETWTNQIATQKMRGRIMAIHATTIAAGFVAGPIMLTIVGTDGAFPFYFCALVLIGAMSPLLFIQRWFPQISSHGKTRLSGIVLIAPTVFAAAFVAGALDTTVLNLLPVWGLRIGLPESQSLTALSVFIAGNLLLQVPIGWLGDRYGRRKAMILCGSVATLGAFTTSQLTSYWYPMLSVMFIWGGFGWALYSLALAMMGERFTGGALAAANAAFVMAFEIANITAPPSAGFIMDKMGPNGLLAFMGGITFVFTVVVAARGFSRRTKGEAEECRR